MPTSHSPWQNFLPDGLEELYPKRPHFLRTGYDTLLLVLIQRLVQCLAGTRDMTRLLRDMNFDPRQRMQAGRPLHQRANSGHHRQVNYLRAVKKTEAGEILARRLFISGEQLAGRIEWRGFGKLLFYESAVDHRLHVDPFGRPARIPLFHP